MSFQAITWAFEQPIRSPSAKFLLVTLADFADGDLTFYPTIAHLVERTSMDRKTILSGIRQLRDLGYIVDTDARTGATKKIKVYRLAQPVTQGAR